MIQVGVIHSLQVGTPQHYATEGRREELDRHDGLIVSACRRGSEPGRLLALGCWAASLMPLWRLLPRVRPEPR